MLKRSKKFEFVGYGNGLDTIRHSELVHSRSVVYYINDDGGLQSGQHCLMVTLQVPESLGLGKESIPQILRIPIFETSGKGCMTALWRDTIVSKG